MAEPGDNKTRPTEPRSLLRDLAHELRDALSPVAASIDLLRVRKFEPEAARLVTDRVERALRRAFATLDSFVLAEQTEDGSLVLESLPCRLEDVLEAARGLLGAELSARSVFVPGGAGATVLADPERTAQVLESVVRQASAIASPDTRVEVQGFADTQPGIRVRSRVDRVGADPEGWFHTYRSGSGGMALRTARRIMSLQQGGLQVATRAPGECEFVITFRDAAMAEGLRASRVQSDAATPAVPGAEPPRRILIVDDSTEVRRAYREALLPLGYVVTEAADAEQALSRLEGDAPQVALIDIHLPRINGYRLARSIKERVGSAIHLVMLSGMTLDATTRGLSREAGFDECLDKMAGPLALHALLQGSGRG